MKTSLFLILAIILSFALPLPTAAQQDDSSPVQDTEVTEGPTTEPEAPLPPQEAENTEEPTAQQESLWPGVDKVPPELPMPTKCNVENVILNEPEEEGGSISFSFSCPRMNSREAKAYLNELRKKGWKGDYFHITLVPVKWRGAHYEIVLEFVEVFAGNASFKAIFSLSSEEYIPAPAEPTPPSEPVLEAESETEAES